MAYRGEDLDLRTPQSRQRETYSSEHGLNGGRQRTPAGSGSRNDMLLVDDTVLACCNHAFDVAQAHGSSEVRLEHLVHALTRVEAAAEILEERGIREAHLRRESAAVIASEIPVGLGHSHSAPRASVEFEDVLRRASDQGRSRGSAASVHDLLWILLNYNRDIAAISLLLRHARDWQTWDWPHKGEQRRERRIVAESVPPPPRQRVVERIVEEVAPQIVERIVEVPRQEQATASGVYGSQLSLEPVHSRLDHMESSLRKIQSDIAADRRAFADSVREMMREGFREMAREVQREIAAVPRGAGGAMPQSFFDRVDQIERMLEGKVGDLGRTATSLADRLQALERSVQAGMQEGARNWAAMSDRLKAMQASAGSGTDASGILTEHVRTITTQVQSLEQAFDAKLRVLDEGLSASRRDGTGVGQMVNERFQALRQQLEQQNLATASLIAQLTEPVTERLRQLETTIVSRPAPDTGLGDRIERALSDRMSRVEQAMANIQQVASQGYQLSSQTGERLRSMEANVPTNQMVQGVVAKLTHVEQLVQSHGDRAVQYIQQVAQQGADANAHAFTELQEAVVKIGTNQQTISESLDQWRTESEGGLSILSNRLEVMETATAQPMQMLKQMQADLVGLQKVTIADYDQNRRGIRNWLFGTEDIFAGSWRDETRQIRERLAQAREDRAERAEQSKV